MKQLLMLSLFCLATLTSFAQEEKQSVLGGFFNFNYQNNSAPYPQLSTGSVIGGIGTIYGFNGTEFNNTTFSIAPYYGRKVGNNWLFGGQVDLRFSAYKADDVNVFGTPNLVEVKRNATQIGLDIFGRYYMDMEKTFSPFVQPFVGFSTFTDKEERDGDEVGELKANIFSLGLTAGFQYRLNDSWNILARFGNLGIDAGNQKDINDNKQDFLNFNANLNPSSIFIGIEKRF